MPGVTMMDLDLLARGTILGFTIAVAVGPISLLTIRRTLTQGLAVGLASGLGVATADAAYGGVAAFGLTAISDVLVGHARILGIVGGAALMVIGVATLRSVPSATATTGGGNSRGLVSAYGSILALTLTNPMTILSFAALFASFGVAGDAMGAASLTGGVFLGSATWWVVLTGAVTTLRSRVTPRRLRWVNVVSGAAIVVFGIVSVLASIRG
jgi:threonine/homoserine/homoserine lactone efflux protein